ncbi:MAG: hypothetical protein HY075_04000 [Deltaproteobacteria bacterium]|nr:hypothetical protein [Deltaproteobacteria bacterium]
MTAKAAEIRTERGRAWLSARTPEQKISFPAVIAVDRTDPGVPLLRIEAMDPFGATHDLLILDQHSQLTWIDYDQRVVYRVRRDWHGVPLARLPELLLGLAVLPKDGKVGAAGPDGFEARAGRNLFRYALEWIDPGPRLALGEVEGRLEDAKGRAQRYLVHYSHFLDKDDFYLPRDVSLAGFGAAGKDAEHPSLELDVAWRERRWNEPVPMQVFAVPHGTVETFSKRDLE